MTRGTSLWAQGLCHPRELLANTGQACLMCWDHLWVHHIYAKLVRYEGWSNAAACELIPLLDAAPRAPWACIPGGQETGGVPMHIIFQLQLFLWASWHNYFGLLQMRNYYFFLFFCRNILSWDTIQNLKILLVIGLLYEQAWQHFDVVS